MADQHHAVVKISHQVLGPASQRNDLAAFEPGSEIVRKRKPQIRAALLGADDPRALHHRLQAAAHGFDFWQFRHRDLLGLVSISVRLTYIAMRYAAGTIAHA